MQRERKGRKKKKNRLRVGGWFPGGERVKEAAALSLAHLFPAAIVRGIRVIKRLLLDPQPLPGTRARNAKKKWPRPRFRRARGFTREGGEELFVLAFTLENFIIVTIAYWNYRPIQRLKLCHAKSAFSSPFRLSTFDRNKSSTRGLLSCEERQFGSTACHVARSSCRPRFAACRPSSRSPRHLPLSFSPHRCLRAEPSGEDDGPSRGQEGERGMNGYLGRQI